LYQRGAMYEKISLLVIDTTARPGGSRPESMERKMAMILKPISAEIKATDDRASRSIECQVSMPDTLDDAINAWGANVVFANLIDSVTIAAQARMRTMMIGTKKNPHFSDDDIREEMAEWAPKAGRDSDPVKKTAKAAKDVASLSEADQRAILLETAKRLGITLVEPTPTPPATETPNAPVVQLVKKGQSRKRG
jgi:hypothetical protein